MLNFSYSILIEKIVPCAEFTKYIKIANSTGKIWAYIKMSYLHLEKNLQTYTTYTTEGHIE